VQAGGAFGPTGLLLVDLGGAGPVDITEGPAQVWLLDMLMGKTLLSPVIPKTFTAKGLRL